MACNRGNAADDGAGDFARFSCQPEEHTADFGEVRVRWASQVLGPGWQSPRAPFSWRTEEVTNRGGSFTLDGREPVMVAVHADPVYRHRAGNTLPRHTGPAPAPPPNPGTPGTAPPAAAPDARQQKPRTVTCSRRLPARKLG
jgi:hypothetical protein